MASKSNYVDAGDENKKSLQDLEKFINDQRELYPAIGDRMKTTITGNKLFVDECFQGLDPTNLLVIEEVQLFDLDGKTGEWEEIERIANEIPVKEPEY
jgi:hypothetical protein